jgi:hypothetical protein
MSFGRRDGGSTNSVAGATAGFLTFRQLKPPFYDLRERHSPLADGTLERSHDIRRHHLPLHYNARSPARRTKEEAKAFRGSVR